MNYQQLENLLIKKVRYNNEDALINGDSDEVRDGINVFYTFFDALGKRLGISNFGKLVLAKSHFADGYNIDAEIPVSIRDKSPRDAVEKFIIHLDKASEAVDDAVSLNDIEELDDYAGESPTPISNTYFSFATYQFNHPSFAIKIITALNISSDTPNKGIISTTVQILY